MSARDFRPSLVSYSHWLTAMLNSVSRATAHVVEVDTATATTPMTMSLASSLLGRIDDKWRAMHDAGLVPHALQYQTTIRMCAGDCVLGVSRVVLAHRRNNARAHSMLALREIERAERLYDAMWAARGFVDGAGVIDVRAVCGYCCVRTCTLPLAPPCSFALTARRVCAVLQGGAARRRRRARTACGERAHATAGVVAAGGAWRSWRAGMRTHASAR